jgi:hypothetical protein
MSSPVRRLELTRLFRRKADFRFRGRQPRIREDDGTKGSGVDRERSHRPDHQTSGCRANDAGDVDVDAVQREGGSEEWWSRGESNTPVAIVRRGAGTSENLLNKLINSPH